MENGDGQSHQSQRAHPLPSSPSSERSAVDSALDSLYAVVKSVDFGATIDAVVKTPSGATMVRISPESGEGTRFLALQAALRLTYPFDVTTVVENVSTGSVQLQVLLHPYNEQMKQARAHVKSFLSMKIISFVSNFMMVCAVASFALLLQNDLISQTSALKV